MLCLLERYNNHKRRTLDRLTSVYSTQGTLILKKIYSSLAEELYEALEDSRSFNPKLKGFDGRFEDLLERHFKHVLDVGVADGYREVTPENKLSTWLDYGPLVPIEHTLPTNLSNYRKRLSDRIARTIGDKKPRTFIEIIDASKEAQLDYLRRTYEALAKDWLKGEDSITEVKRALNETLRKGSTSMERTFRTETTRWFNETRAEYFESETTATHVQIFAVTDGRTSHICESRNGYVVPIEKARLKKYMPPFHPNCRTVQRALFISLPSHKKLIERGMAMNERYFEALPKGWA